jgi:ATPase subunit of ABC transporter with duplicated ATPase domains
MQLRTAALGEPIVVVKNISKSHDGIKILFQELTFTVHRGERIAVIGANGCGKTSLLRIISGADWPDEGEVTLKKNALVGFLQQDAELKSGQNAVDAIVQADTPIAVAVRKYNALLAQGAEASRVVSTVALLNVEPPGSRVVGEESEEVAMIIGSFSHSKASPGGSAVSAATVL